MRALRAVGAILAAAARLDAQERTELYLVRGPVGLVNGARLLDEIEKRLVVEGAERGEIVARHGRTILARRAKVSQEGSLHCPGGSVVAKATFLKDCHPSTATDKPVLLRMTDFLKGRFRDSRDRLLHVIATVLPCR
jgi:hypothetical protein